MSDFATSNEHSLAGQDEFTGAQIGPGNQNSDPSRTLIIGIGASAGGLEAFKHFFAAMPADSGAAFVLIQHLDPSQHSYLAELLSRYTSMPVTQVTDGTPVEPNNVYIIPPNAYLMLRGNYLHLIDPLERRGMRMPIDFFFRTLAEQEHERSIAIVLSGTGSDGTLGIKRVKEWGGLVLVQDPSTAEYDGMPRSAIATGTVDYSLPVEKMPDALIAFMQQPYLREPSRAVATLPDAILDEIVTLLRVQTGHDFRMYKRNTLIRRIDRRMGLNQIETIEDYLLFLQENTSEVEFLFRDLLISVTNFFRDDAAFHALENNALLDLVRNHPNNTPLRVWVPACATGEEAYSLAIILIEQLEAAQKNCQIQVFATDINEVALDIARSGTYPAIVAGDITPERLQRFFSFDGQFYRVSRHLRDIVVFAVHNITLDPPFSKIDLISCRNLLIYLDTAVQKRIIALFHFSLNTDGILFLGSAETTGLQSNLFTTISKKWRIYRKTGNTQRVDLTFRSRSVFPTQRTAVDSMEQEHVNIVSSTYIPRLLLMMFAPTAVVINQQYDCLYVHNPHGSNQLFLSIPSGEPSYNLLTMTRDDLRMSVRSAVMQALRTGKRSSVVATRANAHNHIVRIAVTASPIDGPRREQLVLVTFAEESAAVVDVSAIADSEPESLIVSQLEHELAQTRDDLHHTIEDLASSNEDLMVVNEEMAAMNEELQSTNEELETSKEELQSLNEELITINSQLQDKVNELEVASNDLINLLSSTAIATLFLDLSYRIKRYTPTATQLFRLIPGDIGRPISDIASEFADNTLIDDAKLVVDTLQPQIREINTAGDTWFIRRMLPYRTLDNRIEGVVVTFTEISALKRVEAALRLSESRFQAALHHSPITVFEQDANLVYTWIYNPALGMDEEDIVGKTDLDLFDRPEDAQTLIAMKQKVLATGNSANQEVQIISRGEQHTFDVSAEAVRGPDGQITGVTCVVQDITARKGLEEELADLLIREKQARAAAEQAVHMRDSFLSIASHELKTPLTALMGNAYLLQQRVAKNDHISDREKRMLHTMVDQSSRLNKLIDLLLDVSRIESGSLKLDRAPLNLSALVEQVVSEVRPSLSEHEVITLGTAVSLVIYGDELRLHEVIQNVISNAVKYSPEGGPIVVTVSRQDDNACVSIQDSGIGISPEAQTRIFEQFYRSDDPPNQQISGMGIGLYVVRQIMDMHGGTIEVQSTPGSGSIFTLCLPRSSHS